jgi:F-box domain
MEFNQLSDEVLEQIFLQIPKHHLLNLTLVSPRFNNVISNSMKLLDGFRFRLKSFEQNPPSRKYSSVELLYQEDCKTLEDFMTNHASTIRHMSLYFSLFKTGSSAAASSKALYEFLQLTADRLESLEVNDYFDEDLSFNEFPPIKFLNLKSLSFNYSATSILRVLHNAKLVDIIINTHNQSRSSKEWAAFFMSQPQLRVLIINGDGFMNEQTLGNVSFQLKDFEIRTYQDALLTLHMRPFLEKFLQHQLLSLKDLRLYGFPLSKKILNNILSSQVETVKLDLKKMIWDGILDTENNSIQRITIHGCNIDSNFFICQFLRCCSQVYRIKFCDSHITPNMSLLLAYDMPSLEILNFGTNVSTEITSYQTLKCIKIGIIDEDPLKCIEFALMSTLANKHLEQIAVNPVMRVSDTFQEIITRFGIEDKISYED